MTDSGHERDLVRRARDGDRAAFRELYERFGGRVYSVARRIAGDEEVARDYAQEAWMRAMRALPSFRGEAKFSTWIHRIAVNVALQGRRTADRRRQAERPLPESLSAAAESRDVLLERRLEQAVERVPEGMREILILHDVEGYTHQEIGETLGIATGTSKSQLFKARARVRELLTQSTDLSIGRGRALARENITTS